MCRLEAADARGISKHHRHRLDPSRVAFCLGDRAVRCADHVLDPRHIFSFCQVTCRIQGVEALGRCKVIQPAAGEALAQSERSRIRGAIVEASCELEVRIAQERWR